MSGKKNSNTNFHPHINLTKQPLFARTHRVIGADSRLAKKHYHVDRSRHEWHKYGYERVWRKEKISKARFIAESENYMEMLLTRR